MKQKERAPSFEGALPCCEVFQPRLIPAAILAALASLRGISPEGKLVKWLLLLFLFRRFLLHMSLHHRLGLCGPFGPSLLYWHRYLRFPRLLLEKRLILCARVDPPLVRGRLYKHVIRKSSPMSEIYKQILKSEECNRISPFPMFRMSFRIRQLESKPTVELRL